MTPAACLASVSPKSGFSCIWGNMRSLLCFSLLGAVLAFGQSDRGTITGTISDPSGAAVANAPVEARNTENGVSTSIAASSTGNYTIPSLPAGNYELRVSVMGFKEFIRQGLQVQNAQTMRIDIQLEVGNTSESITVTDAAPLLKTESGELSHVVSIQRMDNLPILQTGGFAGSGGIRNPITVVALMPGSAMVVGQTGPTVRINGGQNNSQTMLVEGMDASNSLGQGASQQNQVPTDAVQEFAIQTSNYAAEFGQAGSAIMNITFKSGTNSYHGSAYEYFVHEKLNAGQPLLNNYNTAATNIANGNPNPRTRRNDYGVTFGGPISIPKIYDGHDRTFFFFNWEQYRAGRNVIADAVSVPTAAYRAGNFSAALLGNNLGTDPLGNQIRPNMIYDPATRQIAANGTVFTTQFANNTIPTARLDRVALKVQDLLPAPTSPTLINNNFQGRYSQERVTQVPSIKGDQVVNSKNRFSFSWNGTSTKCDYCAGAEGLPLPVTSAIGTDIRAHTERLNWDTTITPTILLHWGAGFTQNWLGRPALFDNYDATAGLGLTGPFTGSGRTFPAFTSLGNAQGGSSNVSSTGALADDVFQQGTANVSLSWVKGDHTFKFGGELRNQGDYRLDASAINGTYGFGPQQTAMPYVVAANANAQISGQAIGFPYASFLLGLVNSGNVRPGSRARLGKSQWGFYVQDNWKVTRKLTLDYGLRYDYSTYFREQYGRMANLAPNVPNPTSGNYPGAVQYEATCGCRFAKNYPFGFGPRLGVAYQIDGKTVLRAGFGIVYTGTSQYNLAGGSIAGTNPFGPNSDPGREIMTLGTGVPLTAAQIAWPNFSPGFFPINAKVGPGPTNVIDQNAGRPGRSYQWSIGLQREITKDLVVEASYVANRQVWLISGTQVNYNYIPTSRLQAAGLSLNTPGDLTILNSTVTSANAGRFRNQVPFSGFTGTVAQSLRLFPQFNGGLTPLWSPLGKAWYDSLQLKVTQRLWHGLDFTYAFTYSKEIDTFSSGSFDVENRQLFKTLSSNSRPLISGLGMNYTVPVWQTNKVVSHVLRDWQVGGFLQYASGTPFAPPAATTTPSLGNVVFKSTFQNRVADQPLFTVPDLNCQCYDPNTTFVLNKNAWANPAPGQFGGATFYNDFRRQRHPIESLSLARIFRINEVVTLQVRVEMTNVFNRAYINDPTSGNPAAAQTRIGGSTDPNAQTTAGYGFINNAVLNQGTFATGGGQPRQGQMVARITF